MRNLGDGELHDSPLHRFEDAALQEMTVVRRRPLTEPLYVVVRQVLPRGSSAFAIGLSNSIRTGLRWILNFTPGA